MTRPYKYQLLPCKMFYDESVVYNMMKPDFDFCCYPIHWQTNEYTPGQPRLQSTTLRIIAQLLTDKYDLHVTPTMEQSRHQTIFKTILIGHFLSNIVIVKCSKQLQHFCYEEFLA